MKQVFIKGANFSLKFSQLREEASKAVAFVCNGAWQKDPQPASVPGGVHTCTMQHGARTKHSFWRSRAVSLQCCPQANVAMLLLHSTLICAEPASASLCANTCSSSCNPNTIHEGDKIMLVTISFGNKNRWTLYFSNPSPAHLPNWRPIFLGHMCESLGPSKLLTDFSGGKSCL